MLSRDREGAVVKSKPGQDTSPLPDAPWKRALEFADRYQLKLLLDVSAPDWVRAEIERDRARNRERNRRLLTLFAEVERAAAGLPFAG